MNRLPIARLFNTRLQYCFHPPLTAMPRWVSLRTSCSTSFSERAKVYSRCMITSLRGHIGTLSQVGSTCGDLDVMLLFVRCKHVG